MKKLNYSTTIAIDPEHSVFHFYSMIGDDRSTIAHHIKSYAGGLFDEEFFKKFKEAVKEYASDTPSEKVRKVTVVLPDCAVLTDTVRIPTMKGLGQTKKTLDATLAGLYRNYSELHIISHAVQQNKQYSTFAIAAVQKHIVTSIYAACSENKLLVDTLTYASCAAISGALTADPRLKGSSYLFLDIKDVYSRFVFVANGKTVGYYSLPFGLELLKKPKVVGEDMLFDHSFAELTVINAGERARSKRLTVMGFADDTSGSDEDLIEKNTELDIRESADEVSDAQPDEPLETDDDEGATDEEPVAEDEPIEDELVEYDALQTEPVEIVRPRITQKVFTRKTPRRLPQFMLRPIPETEEGISAENFRVFVKWALTLINGNERLTELGKPEFVCVNIPGDMMNVLNVTNEEAEENGINFVNLPRAEESAIFANLELFGGFFPTQITPTGKF